jgi:ligand-binding SRPBCC domain-containing protein
MFTTSGTRHAERYGTRHRRLSRAAAPSVPPGMFRYHVLRREQRLPAAPEEVFAFFADAHNLEAITPAWLSFRVVTPAPVEMRPGALIEYRLRLHGVPVAWLTRIEDWTPGVRFVDVQLAGPYALWHHTHEFAADGADGTIVRDVVRYAMPWWPLGELAHALLVRRDLERIFDHRHAAVARRIAPSPLS